MSRISISRNDDEIIERIKGKKGLGDKDIPKWTVFRLALAKSLRVPTEPNDELDKVGSQGKSYHLEQVAGKGLGMSDNEQLKDFTDAFCAILSVYHNEDLFQDGERFNTLLQRHIRRGLQEINLSWRDNHDFHEFLYQELFADIDSSAKESLNLQENLLNALTEIGVRPEIREQISGPRLNRFHVYLPDINDMDRLRRGVEKISFSMGLRQQKVFLQSTEISKVIAIDVPRPPQFWQKITGANLKDWVQHPPENMTLPVWLGVDVLGNPFSFDLVQTPHLFVGGTTGSGKSVCLHSILLSLLWRYGSNNLQICLIDPKEVEFTFYKRLPHLLNGKVLFKVKNTLKVLNQLIDEMENRTSKLANLGFQNLEEGRKKGKLDMPRIAVFIEELADLLLQSRVTDELLVRLAQKGRAVGIHLIIATQRPDAETFSGLLRSNIPSRIALSVQKSSESKIILDEIGAERLSGPGDMLVKIIGSPLIRVHGIHVGPDDIAVCLKHITRNAS
ncbi:MAG: DndE family protein [Desulfobacteraceae bacterium]|nr:DndE family protein [Desulfobacteraceae bacterium]